ncbi:MAG: transmembrane sensor [Saprospiraceae bacterium]|jgi:transmembrane sensor
MLNDELLHKWVNGTLEAEELERFKRRPEYDSLVELYKGTDGLSAPGFDNEAMLAEILSAKKKAAVPVDQSKRRFLSTWMKYAAAASILFLVTWFFWPGDGLVVYDLAKGERKEGLLPDQSTFVLNAESKMSYDAGSWDTDRGISLQGEAFFNVKKGAKFIVKTPNGNVQVLGTQFNVWSRKGILEVKCQSGKVAILSTDGKILDELNPNDAIRVLNGSETEKWQFQSGDKATWLTGVSSFRKVTVEVVLEELERQFNVQIDIGKMDVSEIISCNFQHKDLEMALKTCLAPLGFKYDIQDGGKVILSKE